MSLKIAQLMGKNKDAIVKFIPLNVKDYSRKLEDTLKRKSQKLREEEKKRHERGFPQRFIGNRQPTKIKGTTIVETNTNVLCPNTVTYDYAIEEADIPDPNSFAHEDRRKREKINILKLNKQYFDYTYHPFHMYYYTPYQKKPFSISCFNQFSEDRSNYDLLEDDYEECYETKLLSIKNLGRYDCWEDKTPEELMQRCKQVEEDVPHALSPMYDYSQEKFIWNTAFVLDYNPETCKYLIKFLTTKKEVPRLSLVFLWENRDEFDYRKFLCEERRAYVDQFILFTRYVDNVPDEIVSSLNFDWKKRIETKIRFTTRRLGEQYNILFDETDENYKKQIGIITQDYLRQMKKCRLLTEMQEPTNFKSFKKRSLIIRPFFKNVPTEKIGIVNRSSDIEKKMLDLRDKDGNFLSKNKHELKNMPLFMDTEFVDKMLLKILSKTQQMTHVNLIISTLEDITLPFDITKFKEYCNIYTNRVNEQMKKLSSKQFADQIKELDITPDSQNKEKKSKYEFYCNSKEDYKNSVGKRVLTFFNFLIQNKTKELIDNSIINFMHTFKGFGKCTYSCEKRKLLYEKLGSHYLEEKIPLFSTKVVIKQDQKKDDKHKNQTSIRFSFSPSLREYKQALLDSFKIIKDIIKDKIKKLDFFCFRMIMLKEEELFPLEDDYPLYKEALDELNDMIDDSIKEAEEAKDEYKPFKEVMELTEKQYIDSKLGKSDGKVLNVEKCTDILIKLRELEEQLKHKGRFINVRMFRISTGELKDEISKRISSLIKNMLEKMANHCEERTKKILDEKNKKVEMLKEDVGEDFKKYDDLQRLIITIEGFVKEKEIELTNVDEILVQIEAQKHLEIKPDELYWKAVQGWTITDELPMEAKRATEKLNAKKIDLSAKVDENKKDFKKKVDNLGNLFEEINKVDDFDGTIRGKPASSYVNECKYSLISDLEEMEKIRRNMKILAFSEENQNNEGEEEELPSFEKLLGIEKEFEPFKELWREKTEVMSEYQSKINDRTLAELKDPPQNKGGVISAKEEFSYITGLEESFKVVDGIHKANIYDNTICKLCTTLKNEIEYFKSFNWMIENFNSCFLKDEDWKEIKHITGDSKIDNKCKLKDLEEKGIVKYKANIELIKTKAFRRQTFIAKYKDTLSEFNKIHVEFKDKRKLALKNIDDHLMQLDELSSDLSNIIANPVTQSDPKLKSDTKALNERIKNSQAIFDEISKVQYSYLYLEPIFNATEINKALAAEKADFDKVNKFWLNLMGNLDNCACEFASFMEKENFKNLFENLCRNTKELQDIIIRLNQYLNTKRREFPRFYFVSDEDLLRILAQSKDPTLVQPHLSKCFEGIHHVEFGGKNEIILKLVSSKGEDIKLIDEVNVNSDQCRGNVEVWLGLLEQSMINTMKDISKKCIADLDNKQRIDWIKDMEWPGQIVQVIDQIKWTVGAEGAIMENKLKDYLDNLNFELSKVVDLVRTKISPLLSSTLSCIIVISVHDRDIIEDLISSKVEKITDFDWKAQMRYYFHADKETNTKSKKKQQVCPISVSMITTELNYGFEYLGNVTRLVITPLTDRCFRTLFGAYNVQYGGAPEGPAGTGKTESVKDLAKCVGVMCNVFNCTEGIKIQGMSKFFKGLASSGCWCCFDEFNRIDTEVLSVIAQQILTIQTALKAKLNFFCFEESEQIVLRETCAINITMNPSYSGRNELPDNLKALFRPCAMMVPDYSLIAQIKLYSFGFQTAKPLSYKIVSSLKLSSEQLSSQAHYDFGMRALNAIIVAAGNEKKKNIAMNEDRIVLKAIQDVNLAKFTTNDTELFKDLVHDLFPGSTALESDLASLEEELKKVSVSTNLQPTENFIKKCIQLWQTMGVRHALMVVGKPGMTKTKVIDTLKRSVSNLPIEQGYNKVENIIINPKSIFQKNLYGYFDVTQEWKKGLLQVKMTELCEKPKEMYKWLIFDGPVDTLWIENMNSLLDDNKKLCLEDSSAIFLADNMNIVFEVDDLREASPATVSRNGMVLCEQDTIKTDDLILSYANTLPDDKFFDSPKIKLQFTDNAIWITNTVLEFLNRNQIEWGLPCDKFHLVNNFLTIFECYMKDFRNPDFLFSQDKAINAEKMDNLLICCVILGILGPIKKTEKLQTFIYDMCIGRDVNQQYNLNFNKPLSTNKYNWEPRILSTKIHESINNIFDNVYLLETGKWYSWLEIPGTEEFKIKDDLKFNELVIPSSETAKISFLIKMIVPLKKHLLLTGNTGTGKTLTILNTLSSNYDNDSYCYIKMSMTAQTTAQFTQEIIEKKLQKSYRKYSPHNGKKGVIFVDDLNMPQKEKYGAQPPIELLRQCLAQGGFFDLNSENKDFVNIVDVCYLGAMGSISSGRTISARYMRYFVIHYAENYEQKTLEKIYDNIVQWFFNKTKNPNFDSRILSLKTDLRNSTVKLYQEVVSNFKATPAKTHYQFNLRDISRVFLGISRANARTVQDENDMVCLWIHECERIFKDRLVNQEDRDLYDTILRKVLKQSMRRENPREGEDVLWGDFVDMVFVDNDPEKQCIPNQYCELNNKELLQTTLTKKLELYNSEIGSRSEGGGPMKLVLFDYAIQHLSRILRIISTYNGNAVLVGVGGSGRKSLTKLATFMKTFTLKVPEGDWKDFFKTMLIELSNKELVLLVSDTQVDDKQIEDLNNMLNNGEIPNLIESQELQTIKDSIPQEYTQGRKLQNDQDIMAAFVENCKAKIHITLCMSPIGDSFRKRILMFPSLVSCTTIDWYLPWPKEALTSVAKFYLDKVERIDKQLLDDIVDICVDMQNTVIKASEKYFMELRRRNYVTPMSFIELLNLFKDLYQKRTLEIQNEIDRYGNGLLVIDESDEKAREMEIEITKLEPQLKEQTERTQKQSALLQELVLQLEKDEEEGRKQEEIASKVQEEAEKQNEEATKTAKDMEDKREHTKDLLEKVKPAEILEMQKTKPDEKVQNFCKYGCYLMMKNPNPKGKPAANPKDPPFYDYHEHLCKNILNKMVGQKFLKFLQQKFDVTEMPKPQMEQLRDLFQNENYDFSNKSQALASIYQAFQCQNNIYFLNLDYLPLKKKADDALQKLNEAKENLRQIKENLANTLKIKEEKENEVAEANRKIKELGEKKERCSRRKNNADILKKSLESEKGDWIKKKESLEEFSKNIIGDILMSSGIISYLGAFTKTYREDIVLDWAKKIKKASLPISYGDGKSPNDIMRSIIGDDMEIEQWKSEKLPNDNFSADNALIMSQSRRFCLLIDPQNQALIWLKEKIKYETDEKKKLDKKSKLDSDGRKVEKRKDGGTGAHYTIKPTMDAKLMTDIALDCCQNGRQLIFENAGEELPNCIAPIYKKEFVNSGGLTMVNMNNTQIEVNENFRFYIITQLPKPHYLPDICVALTIVNFTVTEEGLQDQMLNYLVEKDDPSLNALRKQCIDTKNSNDRAKRKIESDILRQLKESKENATEDNTILDNNGLIESLKQSNATAKNMKDAILKQKDAETRINTRREFLSDVSVHVAQLFFTVCDISSIEPVYQYSLKFFQDIFGRAIDLTPKDPNEKDERPRLERMKQNFNELLYDKICMSLFEKDKLVFSFLMTTKIISIPKSHEEKDTFNKEIRMFVTGGSGKEYDTPNPGKKDEWITQVQWNSLCEVDQTLDRFKGLVQSFTKDTEDWKKVLMESQEPFTEAFPKDFFDLEPFYKLIILRILRPDKVVPALKTYIKDNIGEKYCISPSFDIEKAYDESKNKTPIFFIISPGADPLVLVDKLCKKKDKNFEDDVKTLSLGQGQEKVAVDAIDKAQIRDNEKWILLQNCHLAKSFMNTLEKKIEEIVETGSPFRLFLTALPSNVIPISVIQDSIKIVNEPPRGLKQSLQRTFNTLDENIYDTAVKTQIYRRFAFGFVFFHALILERRKYGPLGWNIPYEFSNGDLSISLLQLKNFLEDYNDIQYTAMNYMVAEANYGGRVTDPADRRLIGILFKDICCPKILENDYLFTGQADYPVPEDGTYKQHEEYINNKIPLNSKPGIFGLHDNADITCAISETNSLLSTALMTLPRSAGSSTEKSPEQLVKETCEDYLKRLPEAYNVDDVRTKIPNKHEESLNSVLHQELMRYNNLLAIVKSSLKNIKDAIDGNAVMTNEIEGMLQSVYDNKTPERIAKVSYPSMMPFSSWIKDLKLKLEFLQKWIDEGIPNIFWISAFYFTHSFLTGILQNYARKENIAIDGLCFDFEVMSNEKDYDLTKKPEYGCYIKGFYIEGARWNSESKLLDESLPKQLLPPMPYIWFKPIEKGKKDISKLYQCPVYRTSRRSGELLTTGQSTNFLIDMCLPFDNNLYTSEHWVKRGTAILCSLNE